MLFQKQRPTGRETTKNRVGGGGLEEWMEEGTGSTRGKSRDS